MELEPDGARHCSAACDRHANGFLFVNGIFDQTPSRRSRYWQNLTDLVLQCYPSYTGSGVRKYVIYSREFLRFSVNFPFSSYHPSDVTHNKRMNLSDGLNECAWTSGASKTSFQQN